MVASPSWNPLVSATLSSRGRGVLARTWALGLAILLGGTPACSDESADAPDSDAVAARLQAEIDAAPAVSALSQSQLKAVRPVLKCVEKLSGNNYRAHFGYTSSATASISIPVGFYNRFFPTPINRGQPTTFLPGSQADVAQIQFASNGLVAWVLGLKVEIATARSRGCPTTGGTGGAGGRAGTGGTAGQGTGGTAGGSGGGGGFAGSGGSGTGGQGQCPSTCDDQNPCTTDLCNAATGFQCSNTAAPNGTACSDGSACTIDDVCTAGVCTAGSPRSCVAADQCHVAGVCDPVTGSCSNPARPNGTSCSDGSLCTSGDVCTAGVCQPGTVTVCTAPDSCHSAGACDPGTGLCANPPLTNGSSCSDGNVCNGSETCQVGICTAGAPLACQAPGPCQVGSCDSVTGCVLTNVSNGTVCQSPGACGAGICQAGVCASTAQTCDDHNPCTADACGPANACTHVPVSNGTSCSDGNACNGAELCQGGACAAGAPVVCVASDQCHGVGTCNPSTGVCSSPALAAGTSCNDGNLCTTSDFCFGGTCRGGIDATCPSEICHTAGRCEPSTGLCSNSILADGTTCTDGNGCTQNDTCSAGACVAGPRVVCPGADSCHAAAVCNPSTGACVRTTFANGTPCSDGSGCTQGDTCVGGSCVGSPVTCAAPDPCHAASCDALTGGCVTRTVANGTPCSDLDACTLGDTCQAGVCTGAPKACASTDGCHPGVCDHSTGACSNPLACQLYGVGSIPGTALDGLSVTPTTLEDGKPNNLVGGLGSAIAYTGVGNLYVATPDRGPNDGLDSYTDRYYLIELSLSSGTVTASLRGAATLKGNAGAPLKGLSSLFDATNSPASLRFDPEGIRVTPSGTVFVSDEYGPFVYELGADGNRIRSLTVPSKFLIGSPNGNGALELPPGNTSGRQSNRGMEGLAISPDGTHLFGMMQSPLIQDGGLNGANSRVGTNVRILDFNLVSNTTREYLYQLDSRSYGISEIVAVNDHQFLVLERDGNAGAAAAFKRFFTIDVTGASDISAVAILPSTGLPVGVTPVSKSPFLDLLDPVYGLAGPTFPEKIEGIAFGPDLPDGRHVVVITNDSDFLAANNNNFYVFTIDPVALPAYQAQAASFSTACVIPSPVTCTASNECQLDGICRPDNGACSQRVVAAGTASSTQVPGDCRQNQCDASGHVVSVIDNTDVHSDGNQCTGDICSAGVPSNPALPAATACSQGGGSLCNGSGGCVQCLVGTDCPGVDTACSLRTCTAGVCGVAFVAAGTPAGTQTAGDCHTSQCDGAGVVVSAIDNSDAPVDGNDCTSDVCTAGVASNPPAPVNTACSAGVCDGTGICVGCTTAAQCPGTDSFCGVRTCNFGLCGISSTPAGTPLPAQIAGDCKLSTCNGIGGVVNATDNADLPVDGNLCTADLCTAGVPSNPAEPYGTTCGTNLICDAGTCGPATFHVVRMGDGSAALTSAATPVFVEKRRLSDGVVVQTVSMPTAVSGGNRIFTDSGSATSDGELALSVDGRYLSLTGYDVAVGTSGITGMTSSAVNRIVGRIDAAGNVDTSTRFNTAFSANNIRMAVSIDGAGFWAGGAGGSLGGAWYIPLGGLTGVQLTSANTRTLGIFNNQLYGGSSSAPLLGVYTIGAPPPPTSGSQSTTLLPGQTSASSYGFVLFDLSPLVSGQDTLYVADDSVVSGNTGGGVQKWTFNGTTWTRVSTFSATTTVGFRGLTGKLTGAGVLLLASGAEGSANRIVTFLDDGSPSITGNVLATAGTNVIFRGVAFSPHN